ncbi:molybdopterin-dependent oxidoreductase [Adlercreutzia sp. ZJ154]|uniref:molybdopterin-dependent oxidoreductase n=1 Tax=Adlercreutzia sp. ZJ154 TaxID=2709790 RepID=UPI0013EDA84C|nr:molybdopterin-dependent oxidoreductase [Adlercreutzia sp. ZJ154]
MTKRIDMVVEQGGQNEIRPDFFREPPVRYTGGDLPWQWEEDGMICTRSGAWAAPGCHDGCGVIIYTDKETGKFIKVEGDPESPYYQGRLCARCITLKEAIYHPDRVLYPMKRAFKDRGNPEAWQRITWDEAYDMILTKFAKIKEESGTKAVVFHLGTGRGGAPYICRLMYAYGTAQYAYMLSGNSCYVPRVAACTVLMGTYAVPDCSQNHYNRYENEQWVAPKNIFVWGNNPIISNADGNQGHWLVDCMKRGSKLVVIDPKLTWMAAHADLWLQIRCGTDAALALGIGKYLIENDLYDKDFVDKWCYGFDEYYEATKEWTLEKTSEITWIPQEKIVRAAEMLAEKPSAIQWGLALDMTMECLAGSAAVVDLWSITGQIDIPGGMVTVHQPFNCQTWNPPDPAEWLTLEAQAERIGGNDFPALKYSGVVLTQADMTIDQMLSERPYKIRANFIMASNPISCTAQEPDTRMEAAYKNAEFNVFLDPFMVPTAQACADLFLPICMYPERNGIRSIYYHIQNTNKACQALGEAKSDMEICFELGSKWRKEMWPGETLEEFFTYTMKETGLTFEEAREENWIYPEYHYYKYANGEQRPDGQLGFNTPTGRVELYSTLFAQWGQKPVPHYAEPPFSPYNVPARFNKEEYLEKYPLIMTTGARQWASFHSEHRQFPHLRALHPNPEFEIAPETAEKYGISDGDWCWIENHLGRIQLKANVSPILDPSTVALDHAWWFPERQGEDRLDKDGKHLGSYDTYASNPNVIVQAGCGESGFGNNCKSQMCRVYKCELDEIYGETDMREIVEKFSPNEELM